MVGVSAGTRGELVLSDWIELPQEVREAVAYSAKNWPKTLTAEQLLRELDALARRIYVLVKP
jgi:hypothetical protein